MKKKDIKKDKKNNNNDKSLTKSRINWESTNYLNTSRNY